MVVIDELTGLIEAFEKFDMPLPKWIIAPILILILFIIIIEIFRIIANYGKNVIKAIKTRFYNRETMQFIEIRKNFVDHLSYEVRRLNREADWNDFHYTELEAEVEVDPSLDLDMHPSKNPIVWIHSLCQIVRKSIEISPSLKIQPDLIQAIMSSKSRSFLVIGDPGSGKTVSLRHLFLEMAKISVSSKDKAAVVPIYLNLKHLDVKQDEVDADRIHNWVIGQLRADQDRTIQEFLDKNFEQMLTNGVFFFLFDSFDEIPAVMDAQEEQKVVHQYAEAMDNFLHSQHQCRGLVSSRPYRAPKIFMGQRMAIRSLSNKRIKKALYKYMGQEMALADQLWQELVQSREDMLYIAQNPFYLELLARYAKENQKLPDRHYDLFEHFVQTRAHTDEERLRHLGLTPAELVERASILAFAMTRTPNVGLEVDVDHVREVTNGFNETSGWDPNMIEPLLNALAYSKLGRISQEEPGNPGDFSFVHRRFHEYFCARYLKQNPHIAPFEKLAADDRWREILVLLCEVLPSEHLAIIFDTARSSLTAGIKADSGSIEHRKAIETIRFLRDGFRSRIDDLPIDIREMCSKFIQRQLESGNLLDQKRAIEGVSIADDESVHSIFESALASESAWLRETAIRSCRILRHMPQQIAEAIRHHIYRRYTDFKIIHDYYATYSVLFSSPLALRPFRSFSKILVAATLFQVLLYAGIIFYGLIFNIKILTIFLGGLLIGIPILLYIPIRIPKRQHHRIRPFLKSKKLSNNSKSAEKRRQTELQKIISNISANPWVLLPIVILYSSIPLSMVIHRDFFFIVHPTLPFFVLLPLIILNVFLLGLVSDYPSSLSTWFLYPVRKLNKMLTKLIKSLKEGKSFLKLILVFLGITLSTVGFVFWLSKAIDIASSQHYSIPHIYSAHGFILGTAVVFPLLLIVLFSLFVIILLLGTLAKIIFNSTNILSDQFKLQKLSLLSDSRPSTATKAIQILHLFKSDVGKAQYIQALFRWLPVGTDPQVLIEEASKHQGAVCEKHYQLAEIWEDSLQRNR
jgi:hypothetical protein